MLLKTVLSKTLRRKQDVTVVLPDDTGSSDTDSPGSQITDNHTLSFADANALTDLLISQSRRSKSGLFNAEAPRRPRMRKAHSDADLLSGIEAPTTTPSGLFLSRCHSISTTATEKGTAKEKCVRVEMSSLSLTETFSTTAEVEGSGKGSEGQPEECPEPVLWSSRQEGGKVGRTHGLPRSYSFSFGSNVALAKKWTRDVFQEIKRPLNKEKKRRGKQAAPESPSVTQNFYNPPRPGRDLTEIFRTPATSDSLRGLQLRGGDRAPKRFSKETVKTLEKLDKEETKLKKELARIEREREVLQRHAEMEELDEDEEEGDDVRIGGNKRKENEKISWKKKGGKMFFKSEKNLSVRRL